MAARTFSAGAWADTGLALTFIAGAWTGFGGPLVFAAGAWNAPSGGGGGGKELEMNFAAKSNGTMPSVADTGQGLVTTWNQTSAALPYINNNRYEIASTVAGSQAGYVTTTAALAGEVVYMECDFNWITGTGTNGQSVALVAWQFTMPSGALSAITTGQGSPAHIIFTTNNWTYQYFPPLSGPVATPDAGAIHTYASPITDTRAQHVTVVLNKAASQITITGADGVPVTLSYSFVGSLTGKFPCCEIFYTNANTDQRIQISSFKASSY